MWIYGLEYRNRWVFHRAPTARGYAKLEDYLRGVENQANDALSAHADFDIDFEVKEAPKERIEIKWVKSKAYVGRYRNDCQFSTSRGKYGFGVPCGNAKIIGDLWEIGNGEIRKNICMGEYNI